MYEGPFGAPQLLYTSNTYTRRNKAVVAPCIIRHFDAVDVATDYKTYYLNRARLEAAIIILTSIGYGGKTANEKMHDAFPALSPVQIYDYLCAAQACIDYDVKP